MIPPVLPKVTNDATRELYEKQQKMPLINPVERIERITNNADTKNKKGRFIDIHI